VSDVRRQLSRAPGRTELAQSPRKSTAQQKAIAHEHRGPVASGPTRQAELQLHTNCNHTARAVSLNPHAPHPLGLPDPPRARERPANTPPPPPPPPRPADPPDSRGSRRPCLYGPPRPSAPCPPRRRLLPASRACQPRSRRGLRGNSPESSGIRGYGGLNQARSIRLRLFSGARRPVVAPGIGSRVRCR
jgi:hypothetical protein